MKRLDSKIAVITGGSAGIGLETAKRFVVGGAYVYITGRRQKQLDEAVASIGSNVTAVRSDASDLHAIDLLYSIVKRAHGRIDILFVNAGFGIFQPLGYIAEAAFGQMSNVNVKGALFTVQKALPLMPPGSSIILTGSITASRGIQALSVYSATKAALRNLVRSWALDF
jgi:NAD(P)-dependent dehydrogenase (short-subunit alcohol dehydrogenase family)